MSTESELYTRAFWKTTFARVVSFAAVSAGSLLANAQLDSIKDAPWYGILSTAVMSGLIVLCALVGGATIRDIAPGSPTSTAEAIAALRTTGRHAKPDTGNETEG
ncbi:hypothetical protein [[Mycobacterium] crassicus]|uniref:Holin n=1 Tax=[Mycobacterium] crassicus TaxID=2872309 RepID=A0ABU5XJQ0_9MYCO|nr:hypothetical protein [Mycolicibacter sp. MYC098]MEB3021326.1 hypothetical protein [Mycolicibacter sp. MYC098]